MAPAAEYVQLGPFDERGHLDEPAGCLPAQERDERSPLRPAREPAEGLEQRQVGLARAMVLDTLAAPDPQVLRPHDLREKGVEEGGLADPGSPVTNTIWRSPRRAHSRAPCSCAESSCLPTKPGTDCRGAGPPELMGLGLVGVTRTINR